jgi:S-adenosylmethionine:tRNA ribosyltransferase-isomerase
VRVELFDFHLPPERIAYTPAEPRESAQLLHVTDTLTDKHIADLPELLNAGDIVVFNNSKVIPARLFTKVGDKQIEVLLHRKLADGWSAFAKPARKLKEGMTLTFGDGFYAEVTGRTEDGQVLLCFEKSGNELHLLLELHGHMPLPPYISREDTADDKTNYQTVYARHEGSVAAPTAGLHFTHGLLERIKNKGVHAAHVTLHVGAGTFQPVKVEDTAEHVMHHEWAEITQETADAINAARAAGGKVIVVGTTSLRILETAAAEDGTLKPYSSDTNIFITPGYRFKVVDRLMTNFHLPKSTLFMLVSAFAGLERMQAAYTHAIANGYRFYSYGDACLLERAS